jgi:hypothetical protein
MNLFDNFRCQTTKKSSLNCSPVKGRARGIAVEKGGDHYQVIVQISTKYRGSFNTLAFGEIKPYIGSLKDGRLDLVYYLDPGLTVRDQFAVWTLH